ncbi:hypothetical protein [Dehalobacter sp. TeCB1]|uniref:hypothetical protein n=1 Tax=Dehalobacter sp. TeCB1 TaxID=1843715 RepID=UPI00083BA12D|nr:hypothetical protein [Dehalobacter sp. TeCB1]OCZ49851.1 hypothetical protein A7D23_00435 [Dehalobacter sp. TeCB1]
MKKSMIGLSMAIALVIFGCAACAQSSSDLPVKQTAEGQVVNSDKTGITASQTTSDATEQYVGGTNSGVTILTKSDNVYTDAQKQQTLKELSGEIDKLIESINNLDEAQDSQLTFDE